MMKQQLIISPGAQDWPRRKTNPDRSTSIGTGCSPQLSTPTSGSPPQPRAQSASPTFPAHALLRSLRWLPPLGLSSASKTSPDRDSFTTVDRRHEPATTSTANEQYGPATIVATSSSDKVVRRGRDRPLRVRRRLEDSSFWRTCRCLPSLSPEYGIALRKIANLYNEPDTESQAFNSCSYFPISLQCPPLRPTTLLPVRLASIPTLRTATGRLLAPTALASTGTAKSNSTQDSRGAGSRSDSSPTRRLRKRTSARTRRRRDPDNNDDDDAGQGQRRGDDDESDDDSNDNGSGSGGGSGKLARADQARTLSPQLSSASASGARSLPPRPGTTSASASAPGFSSGHSALTLPPRPRPRGRRSKEGQAKQNARRQLWLRYVALNN
ncbi:hypothetical protein A4X06_0g6621 [Tilletia controversa]|uniref:Uncharacterized protein n=1 Tax=Tilletia controversa TaxID=13291 RepID=A0A8X7MPA9_9BASI|nr:hypothetical protein A4X06_0g6621 [Tilletia controversa]